MRPFSVSPLVGWIIPWKNSISGLTWRTLLSLLLGSSQGLMIYSGPRKRTSNTVFNHIHNISNLWCWSFIICNDDRCNIFMWLAWLASYCKNIPLQTSDVLWIWPKHRFTGNHWLHHIVTVFVLFLLILFLYFGFYLAL